MEAFVSETGRAVVIPNDNINTDIILPKQFLKNILKTGFGKDLFYDWRYNTDGSSNEAFELNKPEHKGASILITGNDFGSGSSREHAVWALTERVIERRASSGLSPTTALWCDPKQATSS